MVKSGTKEWAQHSKNICNGCPNDCRYCYARYDAVRFKRNTPDNWKNMVINEKKLNEKPRKLNGRIMFPTTHDITKENIEQCVAYLKGWLAAGNEVLIVSKPDKECIITLCRELAQYKSQIVFRFTIGSWHDDVLKFWEPNAPCYSDRIQSLKIAFDAGFKTSVSCEPYLDEDIIQTVDMVIPFVSDVVWIGKMNKLKPRVNTSAWTPEQMAYLKRVQDAQTDDAVKSIYEHFKDNPKVRWKESIKKVLGLPEEDIG